MKQSAHQVLEVDKKPSDDFLTFEDAATDKCTNSWWFTKSGITRKWEKSVVYNLCYFLFNSILCFYLFRLVSIPTLWLTVIVHIMGVKILQPLASLCPTLWQVRNWTIDISDRNSIKSCGHCQKATQEERGFVFVPVCLWDMIIYTHILLHLLSCLYERKNIEYIEELIID